MFKIDYDGWTYELLPTGRLWRDGRGRPRVYIGMIKNRFGIWKREYRVKIKVTEKK